MQFYGGVLESTGGAPAWEKCTAYILLFEWVNGIKSMVNTKDVDHHKDHDTMKQGNNIILSRNGNESYKRTTKGWKFLVEWKDGTSSWVKLRELNDSFPIKLAEYSITNKIQDEPVFIWWVPHQDKIQVLEADSQVWY